MGNNYPSARLGNETSLEERRKQVLEAAVHSLTVNGYETVRLRDIARRAGVSTGLIQHYFESRDELLEEAFNYACRQFFEQWTEPSDPATPSWNLLVDLLDETADPFHALTWIEFTTASARHESLRDALRSVYDRWEVVLDGLIVRGAESGEFSPLLSVNDIIDILMVALDGGLVALASETALTTPEDMRDRWRMLARTLLRPAVGS